MPVPIPVNLVMGSIPLGFKGNLQELANVIVDNISATVDATFLVGQVGGNMPTSDVGPWANGNEWYFFDKGVGKYVPSPQGTPVGTIVMWGGTGVPANWLLCDGSAKSSANFNLLYQAIGGTWGENKANGTFNLPPGGKFFVNAPGWVGATEVPVDSGYTNQGVNARGGAQTVKLAGSNIPALQVKTGIFGATSAPSGYNLSDGSDGQGSAGFGTASVRTTDGTRTGDPTQTKVPTVPPYVAVNYIIKYQ
jgi:microcystin-dependent protein